MAHALLQSSRSAGVMPEERKIPWQLQKEELPVQWKLKSAASKTLGAVRSLLRNTPRSADMDLLQEICMRMMPMQQEMRGR